MQYAPLGVGGDVTRNNYQAPAKLLLLDHTSMVEQVLGGRFDFFWYLPDASGPFWPIITKWPFLAEGLVTAIF